MWAADCAQHVLHFFEHTQPNDDRPRRAIELTRAWVRGEVKMTKPVLLPATLTPPPDRYPAQRGKLLTPPDKPRRWLMWQPTNWVQRPTRLGPRGRRLLKLNVTRLVAWSAGGSVHSFPTKSESSCLTTRGCAMRCAGSYSIAEQLAWTSLSPRAEFLEARLNRLRGGKGNRV